MALVLCLGNPGKRYVRTRHNAGWQVLDELKHRWDARDMEPDATFRAWSAGFRDRQVVLMQPLTFMNLSGEALTAWRARHPDDDELLVVADDVYLPVGWLRLRPRGSSGGHRGLASIEGALGSTEYARLRVGVGAVESEGLKLYVLEEPAGEEAGAMEEAIRVAADAVECWLEEGILAAMNRFNRKVPREATES